MDTKAHDSSDPWTRERIPRQDGRTALVTGANSGIGFETAKALAEHGAAVVLACRDPEKADVAASQIKASVPAAALTVLHLDLASLACVRDAAQHVHAAIDRLDLLICNAGVGWAPYARTEDGFELTFATNHLGHFALTGRLLDLMLEIPGSRIVAVTSPAHRQAKMPLSHSSQTGALAILRAVTDPDVSGGEYYAPSRRMEFTGHPARRYSSDASHDRDAQRRLWEISAELTAVPYPISEGQPS